MGSLSVRRKVLTEILQTYENPASSPGPSRCLNLGRLIESIPCCYAGHLLVVNEPCQQFTVCRITRTRGYTHDAFGEFHV
jgi:hypothetical protein